jgi:GNAT superfamily N-acetyltransferase
VAVDVRIDRVSAIVTWPLRQRVLRPHQTPEQMALPDDEDPDTGHYAALDAADCIVGTASVRRESPPWDVAAGSAWRLRGMATDDSVRNRGIGSEVLAAAVAHVAGRGGGLLWCNARIGAVAFYERAGFETRGEPFDEPDIGPHVAMWRHVEPGAP